MLNNVHMHTRMALHFYEDDLNFNTGLIKPFVISLSALAYTRHCVYVPTSALAGIHETLCGYQRSATSMQNDE